MNQADWAAVKLLFPQVQALVAAERADFLARHCADSPAVRAEIEALLEASEEDPAFLENPVNVTRPGGGSHDVPAETLPAGTRLGAWEIREPIGRGGMGDVYRAARADGAFAMDAALKVLKRGLDTDAILRRSLRERRILARLSHPNIARLLDAGATANGRPFLVMELVRGVPITDFCEREAATVPRIVTLMRTACEAVAHAHRQLIVHRDLKPSNVLVDDAGDVKLLDFGIAKLLVDDEPEASQTVISDLPMTPSHAAPEQLFGAPVTTATDVYALGVMLYRLLAGAMPHRRDAMTLAWLRTAPDSERIPPPSEAAMAQGGAIPAEQRASRARQLRGDLDLVILKALAPEPERRYGSAQELADDLGRWLAQFPVRARPDSAGYRASRFVRRHRAGVMAAAAAAIALCVGLAAALWQAREARAQRDEARASEARTKAMQDYLMHMFRVADDEKHEGESVSARTVLEKAAGRVREEFRDDPEAARKTLLEVGELYFQIADYAGAETAFGHVLEMNDAKADAGDVAWAKERLAVILFRKPGGESDARRLLAEAQTLYAADPSRFRESLENSRLTQAQFERDAGRPAEAVRILEALAASVAGDAESHTDRQAVVLNELANAYATANRLPEAVRTFQRALDAFTALGQGESANAIVALENLCEVQRRARNLAPAEACARRAVGLRTRLYGHSASSVAGLLALADILIALGRSAEALTLLEEADGLAARFLPAGSGTRERLLVSYAHALTDAGRLDEADAKLRVQLATLGGRTGLSGHYTGLALVEQARLALRRDRPAEAAALLERADPLVRIAHGSLDDDLAALEAVRAELPAAPAGGP